MVITIPIKELRTTVLCFIFGKYLNDIPDGMDEARRRLDEMELYLTQMQGTNDFQGSNACDIEKIRNIVREETNKAVSGTRMHERDLQRHKNQQTYTDMEENRRKRNLLTN